MENTGVRTKCCCSISVCKCTFGIFLPKNYGQHDMPSFIRSIIYGVVVYILPTFYAVFTFNEKRVHKLKSDISVRCRFMLPLSCECVCVRFFPTSSPSSCTFGRLWFLLGKISLTQFKNVLGIHIRTWIFNVHFKSDLCCFRMKSNEINLERNRLTFQQRSVLEVCERSNTRLDKKKFHTNTRSYVCRLKKCFNTPTVCNINCFGAKFTPPRCSAIYHISVDKTNNFYRIKNASI